MLPVRTDVQLNVKCDAACQNRRTTECEAWCCLLEHTHNWMWSVMLPVRTDVQLNVKHDAACQNTRTTECEAWCCLSEHTHNWMWSVMLPVRTDVQLNVKRDAACQNRRTTEREVRCCLSEHLQNHTHTWILPTSGMWHHLKTLLTVNTCQTTQCHTQKQSTQPSASTTRYWRKDRRKKWWEDEEEDLGSYWMTLKKTRRYWQLKEEMLYRTLCATCSGMASDLL